MSRKGLTTVLEPEAFRIIEDAGIRCPRRLWARQPADVDAIDLSSLRSSRAVVKVISPEIAHKSDVGGVAIVECTRAAVATAIRDMQQRLTSYTFDGFSIAEFIPYDASPGGEWLLGLRWTDDFGPVVSVGAGGIATEFLANGILPGRAVAVFSPSRADSAQVERALEQLLFTPLATGKMRNQPARTSVQRLREVVERFAMLASSCRPDGLCELEINPLVPHDGELIALDVLAINGSRQLDVAPPRPRRKIAQLLAPRTIAVAGVSASMNPGHIILNNLLREGFDKQSIFVVKPATSELEGCRAVPSIASLPEAVDLLVLSIPATHVPEAIIDTIEHRKAESVIVIPGGLEEKAGTAELVSQMHQALAASRLTDWQGPIVNGGNCLGIQSAPGHYDTMFLEAHKLRQDAQHFDDHAGNTLAIVAQSGAFAASRITRLNGLRPRYCITVGNQMDLTIGDYLTHLQSDPELRVFGVYVEGFKALDGAETLDAIRRITAAGSTVVLYRAGRTAAGAQATASHTASVAGDYAVTRELAKGAGAIVAETLDDFTELLTLFTLLQPLPVYGRRIGAVSNAGYECVAIADNLGDLELAPFTGATVAGLSTLLERARLSSIVDVHNPLDLTPLMDDSGYEAVVRRILDDDRVDVGVVGCVPATSALNTLLPSSLHGEDLHREDSIAQRLVRLRREHHKPWVAVVDAGSLYDPLARELQRGGIPTFRAADRALRLLNIFVEERLADTVRAQMERWVDAFDLSDVLRRGNVALS